MYECIHIQMYIQIYVSTLDTPPSFLELFLFMGEIEVWGCKNKKKPAS